MKTGWFCAVLLIGVSSVKAQDTTFLSMRQEAGKLMQYLADDALQGRSAFSPGNRQAAAYIANYLDSLGLQPMPDSGFLQRFPIYQLDSLKALSNVVAILPGISRPQELVLISAHFDHLPPSDRYPKDSIFNGANDNASGTVAMMLMARYFASLGNNTRSLVFCAFNAEEAGLIGSTEFSENIDPARIIAGINLEMLGLPQFGRNRLFITGYRYSNLGRIIKKNLAGSGIRLQSERGTDLFARSDNFPFAVKGVPAHSFISSNDNDRCYHKPCDEWQRMDLDNLTRLTLALAKGLQTIISGAEAPTRINWKREE